MSKAGRIKVEERIPHGVICYWQYTPPPDERSRVARLHRCWECVEAYPIDSDGYPLAKVKHTGDINSRQEWDNWMHFKPPCPEGTDPEDWAYDGLEDHMGRCVTIWTWEHGCGMMEFHPPEYLHWLGVGFYEKLCKEPHPWDKLECGHDLYFGTSTRAAEIIASFLKEQWAKDAGKKKK